jgi:hypothetical protein
MPPVFSWIPRQAPQPLATSHDTWGTAGTHARHSAGTPWSRAGTSELALLGEYPAIGSAGTHPSGTLPLWCRGHGAQRCFHGAPMRRSRCTLPRRAACDAGCHAARSTLHATWSRCRRRAAASAARAAAVNGVIGVAALRHCHTSRCGHHGRPQRLRYDCRRRAAASCAPPCVRECAGLCRRWLRHRTAAPAGPRSLPWATGRPELAQRRTPPH